MTNDFYRLIYLTVALLIATAGGYTTVSAQTFTDSIPVLKNFQNVEQDTLYVQSMRDHLTLRVYNIVKTTDFSIRNNDLNQRLRFSPNNGLGIGLGFSYKMLALDLGFMIPGTMRYSGDVPTTKFDLLSTLYGRKHVFDLTLQYYEGYFLRNAEQIFQGNIPPAVNDMRTDISSIDLALSYLFVLNNKKFSFQAAFLGDMIQRRSAGSVTFHGFASLYGLGADSALVLHDFEGPFNQQGRITEVGMLSTGTGVGYAHTFVLPKNFFITLSGAPLVMMSAAYATVNDPEYSDIEDVRLNLRLFTRNAIGYNSERFYLIFNAIYDNFFIRFGDQTRFDYSPLKMKLFFGYRLSRKQTQKVPLLD